MMIVSILVSFFLSSVVARPDGSPVCTVGSAAPQGAHLSRNITVFGPLAQGSFKVTIGALQLSSSGFNNITSGTDLNLELSGGEFKGVLIILNSPGLNLTSSLTTTSTLLKTQALCPPAGYGGFTHVSRDLKTTAAGIINVPANVEAFLDVNVVVVNNSTAGSIYYYSRYQLSSFNAPPVTTPVSTPVAVPKAAPVQAPVPVIVAPVPTPTNAPITSAPTKAPARESCGLLGLSIFCLNGCGLFGRIFGLC